MEKYILYDEDGRFVSVIRDSGIVVRLEPRTTLVEAQHDLGLDSEIDPGTLATPRPEAVPRGREWFLEKLRREDQDQGIYQGDW